MSKSCIVTGASRGLGRGIAHVLAVEEGCKVYATARTKEALESLSDEVSSYPGSGQVIPCPLDQSDDGAVKAFVQRVESEESQIDLLVNSAYAGLVAMKPYFGKPFWERPQSVFDASIGIGLRSAHVLSSLIAPSMVKKKSGLIVQISSFGGVSYLFDIGYGVGKAALDRLTADMAAELKPHGVHAVTLYPGGAVTEIAAFPDGETPVFTGRAVACLLNKATEKDLSRYSGKVVQTVELALDYGFVDSDGELPKGPFSGIESARQCREVMNNPLTQYNLDADLPNTKETNNPDAAGLFPGA